MKDIENLPIWRLCFACEFVENRIHFWAPNIRVYFGKANILVLEAEKAKDQRNVLFLGPEMEVFCRMKRLRDVSKINMQYLWRVFSFKKHLEELSCLFHFPEDYKHMAHKQDWFAADVSE